MAKISSLDLDQLLLADDRQYRATWKFSKTKLKEYSVQWQYKTLTSDVSKNSKGEIVREWVWIPGTSETVTIKESIYTAPTEASEIRVRVKPISKTYKNNKDKEVSYWSGDWSGWKYRTPADAPTPDAPPTPSIKLGSGNKITVACTNLDAQTDVVEFQFVINNKTLQTKKINAKNLAASYVLKGTAGTSYKVRARADNKITRTVGKTKKTYQYWSEWCEYSDTVKTAPVTPTDLKTRVMSTTSVKLYWTKPSQAASYVIAYAKKSSQNNSPLYDLYNTPETVDVTGNYQTWVISGLETGSVYYFRIKALNSDGAESGYTAEANVASAILGTKPSAPTTWSSVTTASTDESITYYWLHNTEDGSAEQKAELVRQLVHADGTMGTIRTTIIDNDRDEYDELTTDTNSYSESLNNIAGLDSATDGDILKWKISTTGITNQKSDYSIERTIEIHSQPELNASFEDGVDLSCVNFPLKVTFSTVPETQTPIGYSFSIVANDAYETFDQNGSYILISAGEEIYSKYTNTNEYEYILEIGAGDINVQPGESYTLKASAAMNSGLLATADDVEFTLEPDNTNYEINGTVFYDKDTLTAQVSAYCGTPILDDISDNTSDDDNETNFTPMSGISLSIYRVTSNGKMILIEEGIPNTSISYVHDETTGITNEVIIANERVITDPHPTLDYCRYRVVATVDATGRSFYEDLPPFPTEETAIVIQWDDEWRDYDGSEDTMENPIMITSMIKLPYNIDVSEANTIESTLINYIGRERPVSYYGTQLGEAPSWSCEIPKDDLETLYQLRRLAVYKGDVYVREPSGTGFWAQIQVSFNITHCALTIPVTLKVTPVEGGI